MSSGPATQNIDSPEAASDNAPADSEAEETPVPVNPPTDIQPIQFDFSLPEVRDAELKAVTAGRAIRWNVNGSKGYAVPSDVTVDLRSGIPCRNVYATVDKTEQQSSIIRMCQSHDGGWAEAVPPSDSL